jgi:hypothetical protein
MDHKQPRLLYSIKFENGEIVGSNLVLGENSFIYV